MGNTKGGVQSHTEEFLQDGREQHGITVIEQAVQPFLVAFASESWVTLAAAINLPEKLSTNCFFVNLAAPGCLA